MDYAYGTLEILNKEIANIGNEQKRHCRIGKVTRKSSTLSLLPTPSKEFDWAIKGPFLAHAYQRRFLVG